ncbi:MAG: hypothetical protein RI957_1425 [Verrucomicrobiota bacterium]
MLRALRILILLLTWVGLGVRAADLPVRIHDAYEEVCGHSHDHEHSDDTPCHDHDHHHCHCPGLSPLFCLPEFPVIASTAILLVSSARAEQIQWRLPDDPVYALDVPPIIG